MLLQILLMIIFLNKLTKIVFNLIKKNNHRLSFITKSIENEVGELVSRDYLASFFDTDSNPTEANIQNLEDEDWRGCCTSWECAV